MGRSPRTRTSPAGGRRSRKDEGFSGSTVSGRASRRPGCSVTRTALPPASPARWTEPARPHLSAAHDVASPEPAAREPRRQARRKIPRPAPGTESGQPAARSHRARRAHAHTARLRPPAPTPGLRAPSPPRALRSNQSAAAGAGPLGGGSPTRRRRAPVPSADPGARGRRSLGPWLRR